MHVVRQFSPLAVRAGSVNWGLRIGLAARIRGPGAFVTGESVNFGIIDKVCLTGHPILAAGSSPQRTRHPVLRRGKKV